MGEEAVGKTSLIRRYVVHSFDADYTRTLGVAISKRTDLLTLEDGRESRVTLQIWDIMGRKGILDLLAEAYFRGAHGGLAVFDVTRSETLTGPKQWIDAALRERAEMPMVVLGNKVDLLTLRGVTDDEAQAFCASLALPYFPASAKTGLNVEAGFKRLMQECLRTVSRAPAGED